MRQSRVPTVQTVQQTDEILQVPYLGLVLEVHGLRPCDHAATDKFSAGVKVEEAQFSSSTKWCFVVDRDRYLRRTVEIPQVQFLNTVFACCGCWHIDRAVNVPVISGPLSCSTSSLTLGFNLDAPTQFSGSQARHLMMMMKVWVTTTTYGISELRMRSRRCKRSLIVFFRRAMRHFFAPLRVVPFFVALDGEEFFAIEGSPCQ